MAKAIASIGDIELFADAVRSCCSQTAEAAENAADNIRAWRDDIGEAKRRCDEICACIASEINKTEKEMQQIDDRIAALSARLASINPYIEETYTDDDGNEHTETKPNPEYDLADWVLSRFSKKEAQEIKKAAEDAIGAVELMVKGSIDKAMSDYNS